MAETSENTKTYDGSCHCGQVKFTMQISPPISEQTVIRCNCSICHANGYLMIYPKAPDVKFHHGDNGLKEYRFASKGFPHYFCSTCGTSMYARAENPEEHGNILAVNVRTLADVDITTLKIHDYDGRGDGKT